MIDNELLAAFVSEMDALRVHGRDFARAYPDVASRLDIGAQPSSDAQVERVIEATAFLAARLRLMIERNATELPLSMLSLIAPSLVEPVPSFALLQLEGGVEAHEIERNVRFDLPLGGGGSLICLSTTMSVIAAPLRVHTRRLESGGSHADGVGIRLLGQVPERITFCLGKNDRTAAALMDAFAEQLAAIEVVREGGEAVALPLQAVRVLGFGPEDAALPVRPATHPAHRVVTEFLVFPAKFRFISLHATGLRSGDEIRFRFRRPINLPAQLEADVISVNRVPVVNLWPTVSAPIDVDGRRLEYPVQVNSMRYRTLECHSIESVDAYQGGRSEAQRLDPVLSLGAVRGTPMQWGSRRAMSRRGSELYMYFRGLDYRRLGRRKFLATGNVLASNRDTASYLQTGTPGTAVDPSGGWSARLVNVPTPYLPGLDGARALETMIGYLNSGMVGFIGEARRGVLQDYLKRFPGADRAPWIDGVKGAAMRPVMVSRGRQTVAGVGLAINFEASNYPNTSQGIVKRVLGLLFESQRGLNRVEQLTIHAS
ncbi:MAG: type VI secretion system baseplate subunit TssF [Gammaproteobacteria bacterium]|nr:type VI secretion system baseplate subunit TssF [Gammaproteobacteria bacterium]MYB38125.1 type VI secretion system baseplate subunit TssF [Gammaproteobacteria bacterium]